MKDCCDWSGLCGSWIPHSSAYSCGRSVCLNPIFLSLPYSFLLEKASIALAAVVGAQHWKYQRKDWAASWIFFPGKVNSPCFFPFFSTSWKSCFFSFFSKKQIELIAEKHRQINFSTACLDECFLFKATSGKMGGYCNGKFHPERKKGLIINQNWGMQLTFCNFLTIL